MVEIKKVHIYLFPLHCFSQTHFIFSSSSTFNFPIIVLAGFYPTIDVLAGSSSPIL